MSHCSSISGVSVKAVDALCSQCGSGCLAAVCVPLGEATSGGSQVSLGVRMAQMKLISAV